MAIQQFNALWAKKEDRIKLSIITSEDDCLKFWLTRFIVKSIIESYDSLMKSKLRGLYDGQTSVLIQKIQKEKAESNFILSPTVLRDKKNLLGSGSLLVIGFDMIFQGDFLKFNLFLDNKKKVGVSMSTEQADAMVALIEKISKTADWNIQNLTRSESVENLIFLTPKNKESLH